MSMRHKAGGVGHMAGDVGALPGCKVKTLLTPDFTAFQVASSWVRSSQNWSMDVLSCLVWLLSNCAFLRVVMSGVD